MLLSVISHLVMPFIAIMLSSVNMIMLGPFAREGRGNLRAVECSFQFKNKEKIIPS